MPADHRDIIDRLVRRGPPFTPPCSVTDDRWAAVAFGPALAARLTDGPPGPDKLDTMFALTREALAAAGSPNGVRTWYRDPDRSLGDVDITREYAAGLRNALRLLAAAGLRAEAANPDRFAAWLARLASPALDSPPRTPPPCPDDDILAACDRGFAALNVPEPDAAAGRLALAEVLGRKPLRAAAVGVLFVCPADGDAGHLHVRAVPWASAGRRTESLFRPRPALFRPFDSEWHTGLDVVWDEYRPLFASHRLDVEWWVMVPDPDRASDYPPPIGGRSAQAAAAAVLDVLLTGRPFDPATAISGTVTRGTPHGGPLRLAGVNGLHGPAGGAGPKLMAAVAGGFRTVVIAEPDAALLGDETKDELARRGVAVRPAATVADAVEQLSGLAGDLTRLVTGVLDEVLLDASRRLGHPALAAGPDRDARCAALDRLLVEVRLARGLRPRLTDDDYRALERERTQGDRDRADDPEPERADVRGAAEQRLLNRPREVIPGDLLPAELAARRRVTVLGDAGYGKTTALWRQAIRRCRAAAAEARDGRPVREWPLVVFARAAELAEHLDAAVPEPGRLTAGVLALVRNKGWLREPDASATVVRELFETGRCQLVLDGLDEVPTRAFQRLEVALRKAPGPVVVLMSSRLAGFRPLTGWVADAAHFELLGFDDGQVAAAAGAWLGDAPARPLLDRLRRNRLVREVLRSPLLLRLACQAAADPLGWDAGRWHTRVELYEQLLNGLMRRVGDDRRPGRPPAGVRDGLVRVAEELALLMIDKDARKVVWERQELNFLEGSARPAAGVLPGQYPADRRLVNDLLAVGLLVPVGDNRDQSTPLMWLHRSFGEYLAARALADRLKRDEHHADWERVDRWAWGPDYEPLIRFLCGLLPDRPAAALLRRLADPDRDDYYRHRRVLAALCLGEMPLNPGEEVRRVGDPLAQEVFDQLPVRSRFRQLIRAWPAVAAYTRGRPGDLVQTVLGELLRAGTRPEDQRRMWQMGVLMEQVGELLTAADNQRLIDARVVRIAARLDDPLPADRRATPARFVPGSGPPRPATAVAVRRDELATHLQRLGDPDPDERNAAVTALRSLLPMLSDAEADAAADQLLAHAGQPFLYAISAATTVDDLCTGDRRLVPAPDGRIRRGGRTWSLRRVSALVAGTG